MLSFSDPTQTDQQEEPMSATFGDVLRFARESRGLSYRVLARRLNVQHVVIYEMEIGKRLPFGSPERLKNLADELDIDLETLAVKAIEGRKLMPLLEVGGSKLLRALSENT